MTVLSLPEHTNACRVFLPHQQRDLASALMEVLKLSDDQLIKCIWLIFALLVSLEAVRLDFLQHCNRDQ